MRGGGKRSGLLIRYLIDLITHQPNWKQRPFQTHILPVIRAFATALAIAQPRYLAVQANRFKYLNRCGIPTVVLVMGWQDCPSDLSPVRQQKVDISLVFFWGIIIKVI